MNKQSSIEWLWHNLTDDLIGDLPNEKIHEIYSLVLQAKQMHKEEIQDAYWEGGQDVPLNAKQCEQQCEQYYQETYGGSPKTSDN